MQSRGAALFTLETPGALQADSEVSCGQPRLDTIQLKELAKGVVVERVKLSYSSQLEMIDNILLLI